LAKILRDEVIADLQSGVPETLFVYSDALRPLIPKYQGQNGL
jgi:hypothetical protein